jgi:hypothetical protein
MPDSLDDKAQIVWKNLLRIQHARGIRTPLRVRLGWWLRRLADRLTR